MKKLILILLVLLTSCATDPWTKKDTAYQGAFLAVTAIDWLQTKEVVRNPNYYEINPVLGCNPKQNNVDLYFAGCAIANTAIAYYLPKEYRRIWQCLWIGFEAGYVNYNYSGGIRIKF